MLRRALLVGGVLVLATVPALAGGDGHKQDKPTSYCQPHKPPPPKPPKPPPPVQPPGGVVTPTVIIPPVVTPTTLPPPTSTAPPTVPTTTTPPPPPSRPTKTVNRYFVCQGNFVRTTIAGKQYTIRCICEPGKNQSRVVRVERTVKVTHAIPASTTRLVRVIIVEGPRAVVTYRIFVTCVSPRRKSTTPVTG